MKQPLKNTKNLLEQIDRKLINQAEIARRLGYSEAYISLILNNKYKNDKVLARILEIVKNAA